MTNEKNKITYLICISNTDYSKVALDFAYKMAKRKKGKLLVLHITEPSEYQTFGVIANKIKQENERNAKKFLKEVTKNIDIDKTLLHKEGFIYEEIIKLVEENNEIDMLIVGAAAENHVRSKNLQPLVSQLGQKILIPIIMIPGSLTEEQIDLLA